jgi:DNA helicase II / ATP-dependent DNA helicase PcrA
LVPGFEAAESNVDGVVRSVPYSEMLDEAVAGDFIISRTNAPLMEFCISFLKQDRSATIQGRDIMGALINIINLSIEQTGSTAENQSTVEFMDWLEVYRSEEAAKLELLDAEEKQIEAHMDRCECLRVLSVECDNTQCLIDKLKDLFSDEDDENKIVLTTAHRSKGLERDRVWLLEDTFRAERGGQEANCLYVAITRARNELIYVV